MKQERSWPRYKGQEPIKRVMAGIPQTQDPEWGPEVLRDTFYESGDSREKLLRTLGV
jgi:hypothetical protein